MSIKKRGRRSALFVFGKKCVFVDVLKLTADILQRKIFCQQVNYIAII